MKIWVSANEFGLNQQEYCVCTTTTTSSTDDFLSFSGKTNELIGSISCRVWKYGDYYEKSESVINSAVVGSKKICLFDHLLAAR